MSRLHYLRFNQVTRAKFHAVSALSILLLSGCVEVQNPSAGAATPTSNSEAPIRNQTMSGPLPPTELQSYLKSIAEASLAANIRKDHPHGTDQTSNPGAPATTSPSVNPGNAFTQGIPGDDIEQTALYSIGSITGESGGFDIFNAVNPADAEPGKGLVTAFYSGTSSRSVDAPGDRYLLGDHSRAYYLGRTTEIDNDFARVMQIDSRAGNEIVLHGTASDYAFVQTTGPDAGTAIFYNNAGVYDMIGYIDIQVRLDPYDPIYKYVGPANAPSPMTLLTGLGDQFGGAGADLVTAIEVDSIGNLYVIGVSRSNLGGLFPLQQGNGQMFVAKYSTSGQRMWLTQFGSTEAIGDLCWDIAVDTSAVYVASRYIAPESVPGSHKDAAYFRFDTQTGAALNQALWSGRGVQYPGAVALDNADFVYFSGIGLDTTAPNPDGSQDPYLEKRRRSDLSLVKRKMFGGDAGGVPGAGGAYNKEPWGGLAFVPTVGGSPGQGRIYSSGWTQGSYEGTPAKGGGDVWLVAFDENLNELWAEGFGSNQRDWAWDLDVDSNGYVYVVGVTLGAMAGTGSSRGQADGFISKFNPQAVQGQRLVWTRQFGTNRGDEFRKIKIVGDTIYVSGHTYSNLGGTHAGQSDAWIGKLSLDGTLLQSLQLGTAEDDRVMLTANTSGVYIGGYTFGSLYGANRGYIDAYVARLTTGLGKTSEDAMLTHQSVGQKVVLPSSVIKSPKYEIKASEKAPRNSQLN
jgi:hypothetical protein